MFRTYERQNGALEKLLTSLSRGPGVDAFLSSHFNGEIQRLARRVNGAFGRLTEIEKEVKSTRVLCFGWFDDKCEKARALGINDRLIQHALLNEQRILVARLKLRIYHDHRDVCASRRRLARLRRGEEVPAEDESEKVRIHALKNAISCERRRVRYLKSREVDMHESAVVIQKHWRGFWSRFQRNRPPTPPIAVPVRTIGPHMDKVDPEDGYYSDYAGSSASEPRPNSASESSGDEDMVTDDPIFRATAVNDAENGAISEMGSGDSSDTESNNEMEFHSDASEGELDQDS
jgi:hypothetical protein